MKKYFMISLAAFSLMLTSCKQDVEKKAHEYSKEIVDAMMRGDQPAMMDASEDAQDWLKDLEGEDKAKAIAIFEKASHEASKKMIERLNKIHQAEADSLARIAKADSAKAAK